ncbi:septum formation protein Maf [Candidatus Woesebacteria bacterium]|nr:septum formation protein Maf [Candidatus Woesebacteria bacterium]
MQKIILASGSPRRKEILELLGLEFEVVESGFDEELVPQDDAVEMVEELAMQKALSVAKKYPDAIVIGGDTTVEVEGEILNKAESADEAKEMFRKLLGKTHRVVTGVAVVNSLTGESVVGNESGWVSLRSASERELEHYVATESNWHGFAGAYALQGGAAPFALNQTGKLSAIIGMPVELTTDLLEQMGVVVEVDPRELEDQLHGMKVGISQ